VNWVPSDLFLTRSPSLSESRRLDLALHSTDECIARRPKEEQPVETHSENRGQAAVDHTQQAAQPTEAAPEAEAAEPVDA
jgi:hypothetical protein